MCDNYKTVVTIVKCLVTIQDQCFIKPYPFTKDKSANTYLRYECTNLSNITKLLF